MNTKYQELKDLIKARAELQRTLKNHRKDVNFKGERLKDFHWRKNSWVAGKGCQEVEVVIPELTPRIADEILRGWSSYVCSTYEITHLLTIYGILRNERKTKKIQCWEDIVNSPNYENSALKKDVDKWRDEETVHTGE